MPELLLELLSEEIPARMQKQAAADLSRLLGEALAPLGPLSVDQFYGPRRIAVVMDIAAASSGSLKIERGPRLTAPQAAIVGFARKHGVDPSALIKEGDYWVLQRSIQGWAASALVAKVLPPLIRRFPWPKSMRWGQGSALTWVRPLRRILCLLGDEVVRFDLRDGDDDGHNLASANLTEGHHFMAPEAFAVTGAMQWKAELTARKVVFDAEARMNAINGLTLPKGCAIVPDPELAAEVAGLIEWPVPLFGRIDDVYMDLPPEVMQVSMRVNQRYFAARDEYGNAAPYFAFLSNIEASDGGAAIVAGNERVLRARFADARHFWNIDQQIRLADRVSSLNAVTFHAKLGSQGDRVRRICNLATEVVLPKIADLSGTVSSRAFELRRQDLASRTFRAALLCKADLSTGLVGEFPELQGVVGSYYAMSDGEDPDVCQAIREHYLPRAQGDSLPQGLIALSLAIADRLDTLAGFFSINEMPTGSSDPFALRRAGLGVIRMIRENDISVDLKVLVDAASMNFAAQSSEQLLQFLFERLKFQLRLEGQRHDIADAVIGSSQDSNIKRILDTSEELSTFLKSTEGRDLLVAYRRANNILTKEGQRDGVVYSGVADGALLERPSERDLFIALTNLRDYVCSYLEQVHIYRALGLYRVLKAMSEMTDVVAAFFVNVTVNDPVPEFRRNRLLILSMLRDTMNLVADFSKIEG